MCFSSNAVICISFSYEVAQTAYFHVLGEFSSMF